MISHTMRFSSASHTPMSTSTISQFTPTSILTKSSSANQILGEMFFYSHMPDQVAQYFPTVHEISYMAETSTYSITMQKLKGTTFSHMFVGRSLTSGRLSALLNTVHGIHTSTAKCTK